MTKRNGRGWQGPALLGLVAALAACSQGGAQVPPALPAPSELGRPLVAPGPAVDTLAERQRRQAQLEQQQREARARQAHGPGPSAPRPAAGSGASGLGSSRCS